MLPPFIIEQIRKREEDDRSRDEQPVVRLPLPEVVREVTPLHVEDEPERGVVVIDLMSGRRRPE